MREAEPSRQNEYYFSRESIIERKGQYSSLSIPHLAMGLEMMEPRHFQRPGAEAVQVLRVILNAIRALPVSAQLSELEQSLVGKLKSNKLDRTHLLEILGYCGILRDPKKPAFHERFVGYEERCWLQPDHFYKRDWNYPVQNWTGVHGVDEDRVQFWFSHLL